MAKKIIPAPADFRVYEQPGTRHRDYVLKDYEPLCDPRGRLHSATVFRYELQRTGLWAAAAPLLEALRSALGDDEMVWGMKYGGAAPAAELYFYNNAQNPRGNPKAAARLRRILKPYAEIKGRVDEALPYFMCSLELDAAGLKAGLLPEFRVYLGEGGQGWCGCSYAAEAAALRLENHYHFYPMPSGLKDVVYRLQYAARGGRLPAVRRALLPARLCACGTVCYAVKPLSDALYFSRISTRQLEWFLARYAPGPLQGLLAAERDGFSHLLWDAGLDFRVPPGGRAPAAGKAGIYGVF